MKPSPWKAGKSSTSIRNSQFIDADPYRIPTSSESQRQNPGSSATYDKNYVENLRKSFQNQQDEKKSVRNNEELGSGSDQILRRLKAHGHPFNLKTLTCLSGYCGRSFERLEVLAFHLSYAHQDMMTSDSKHLTCLICGKKWTSVRRKIMHLSLAHREVGEEHNSQCMLQVESVIAPNAPKAQRLEKARMEMEESGEYPVYLNPDDDDNDDDEDEVDEDDVTAEDSNFQHKF